MGLHDRPRDVTLNALDDWHILAAQTGQCAKSSRPGHITRGGFLCGWFLKGRDARKGKRRHVF